MLSFEPTRLIGATKNSNFGGASTSLGMTTFYSINKEGRGAKLRFFICYFVRAPRPSSLMKSMSCHRERSRAICISFKNIYQIEPSRII